ncbi:hypothetical protein [Cohnella zeiphila]|uniref:Uncharacterized protein n=1 Tax=Cohnella zeiphila TaxID=2761120 RepID=A0A7X0VVL8_9BACL|nr:hypothetical protein [Cohnella zeiphila]MBB6732294.1 hypothetical protein [Cohnella zeiphila]
MFKLSKKVTAAAAIAVVLAGIGGISWYQSAYADQQTATPGSTDDPIVTKSYVDQKLAEIQGGGTATAPAASSKLEVVNVPIGKKLMVDAGGEVIVRNGKALAYSTDANGLSDVTDGIDLTSGKAIATNHLILFPRAGRGIEPDPKQKYGLTVLVRGNYSLQ